jgi:hypothetical protein
MKASARPRGVSWAAKENLRPSGSVAQQPLEQHLILGCCDHENVANPGEHQHRQRIIDHRLVEDGQELLETTVVTG